MKMRKGKIGMAVGLALWLTTPAHAGFSIEDSAEAPKPAKAAKPAPAAAPTAKAEPMKAEVPAEATWVLRPQHGTVRRALIEWAARAGWQVAWEASVEYPINYEATFTGTFEEAIGGVFASLSAADVALNALMYNGNRVVRIVEAGTKAQ